MVLWTAMKDGCMDNLHIDIAYGDFVEKAKFCGFIPTKHNEWLESVYRIWRGSELNVEYVLRTTVDSCPDVDALTLCLGVDVAWCINQNTAFHSELCTPVPATSVTGIISGNTLIHKRCILVGRVTAAQSDHPGQLVISDSTGSIPVEVKNCDCAEVLPLLHQWAVFPSWNLVITHRGKSYLELCVKPEVINPNSCHRLRCKPLTVVTTETASILLLHKDTLAPGCVNIVATVEAVGEIHRVKTDLLFCIRLQQRVNIIVKKPEYLHWQKFLIPGEEMIFTDMRPTTLKKGAGSSVKVFVPWKDSQLLSPSSVDYTHVSLQEWLGEEGKETDNHDGLTLEEIEEEEEDNRDMASYQGVVTSDELVYLGIYILDYKVGLCVSCVPAVHKFQSLRVGSKVIIYNAHISRSKQFPQTRILCCTSSCVKTVEFSSLENKPKNVSLPVGLQQSLKKYCVTQALLDTFINYAWCLNRKFARNFHRELPSIIETTFEHCCSSDHNRVGRLYMQEFLSKTHRCGIMQNQDGNDTYSDVPDMDNFTQEMRCLTTGADNLSSDSSDTDWGFHHLHQGRPLKLLVGILDLSSKNGRVQLWDDTGSVDCVITMTTSEGHTCTQICSCDDLDPGSNFRCPFIHPCCVGAVVAVTDFTVIREQFSCLNSSLSKMKLTDSSRSQSDVCYVVFSLLDVVLMYKPLIDKIPLELIPHKKGKVDHGDGGQSTVKGRQYILITHRETLIVERWIHSDSRNRMAVQGHILPFTDEESINWDAIQKILEDQHSQSNNKQNEHLNATPHQSTNPESKDTFSPAVIFLFQNDAVQWCNTILPGGVYRILSPTEKLCPPGAGSWHLKKAIAKSGGRRVHEVPANAQLFRVFPENTMKTPPTILSFTRNQPIKSILSEKCEETLVSFEGVVVRRYPVDGHHTTTKRPQSNDHHIDSGTGWGSPDGCGVKVVVKCPRSGDEVDVYFNLDSFVYPLGLLPGAGVWLERLERKVSRKNNVYCQYIAVSCLHIQYHTDLSSEIPQANTETGPLRLVYLADIWMNRSFCSPFPVCCHVERFLKVSLKWVCHKCGGVCVGGACPNPGCQSDHGTRFLARAR
ncbi:CST complex subunit CTC1-like isoform X1 [Argopecten irradians]|uniref:CST complex subunit CTC1-like isoform X1 n=1 Tax=Argopecten irradians TaxID=31199 RepID=UPI0037100E89